jgi:hypothetical protein
METTETAARKKRAPRFSGKLFISYRRGDSAPTTGRIHDWLVSRLPKKDIFFDIESIEYGTDFEQRIQQSIPRSKVVLAIIGPHWVDDGVGPSKYVGMELELALRQGIAILPVLVDGAVMPSSEQLPASLQTLSRLNAAEVRSGKDFQRDMEALAKPLGIPLLSRTQRLLRSPGFWMLMGSAVALLGLAGANVFGVLPGANSDPRIAATATAAVVDRTAASGAATANASASQTAAASTAIAGQTAVAVTATANALAPFTFRADVPGPGCDSRGKWTVSTGSSSSGGSTCLPTGIQVTAPATLNFSGASGFAFPVRSAISVDIQLTHPVGTVFVGVGMGGNGVIGATYYISYADGLGPGTGWTISAANRYGVPYTKQIQVDNANIYHITVVAIADSQLTFFVNSKQVGTVDSSSAPGLAFGPATVGISMGVDNIWPPGERPEVIGKALFSHFAVVPQS